MMGPTTSRCWHCGEPLPAGEVLQVTVGGKSHPVCCMGCGAAAEWIDQLGLTDYYRLRREFAPRPPVDGARNAGEWARPELLRHIVRNLDDGCREAIVLLEGVRCSACVWLIERTLGALPGLVSVHVNANARRARIVWQEGRCSLKLIIETLARTGYRALPLDAAALEDSRRREARTALKRLLVAGFGAMQAMMYASALYLGAFEGMDATARDLFRWLGLLVTGPVVFYAAQPFLAGAYRTLRARRLGMDVPVALAILLIYGASLMEARRGGAEVYFDSVAMFVFFLLVGRYLEMQARHRAGDLHDALMRLTPTVAERVRADGSLERVAAMELKPGDCAHVAEGAVVPADGVLLSESCRVDEALLSGESAPVAKRQGDELIAGSIVTDGPARLRIEKVGADTALAGVVAMVAHAATQRPRIVQASERAAAGFVARVLALALITAVCWSLADPSRAFTATLAVLVVSCPCAFALAAPAAMTRALGVLARRGVLIVRADAIERLTAATHVVFDKTGTLTDPRLALERVVTFGETNRAEALNLAAALARGSRHPVAQAIVASSGPSAGAALVASNLRAEAGGGIEGVINGRRLRLGRPDFACAGAAERTIDIARHELDGAVVLADASGPLAALRLSERLRSDARETIAALKADGLEIEIASGDAEVKVAPIAAALGVARWHARLLPAGKLERLKALRASGARVIAVGDGINDAPVLAGADVGATLASGAALAHASSDMVLASERLGSLLEARALARQTLAVMRQNQRWAFAYNLCAVPLAALGFVPPWLAAIGMSASSLIVVLNALRIGRQPVQSATPVARHAEVAA